MENKIYGAASSTHSGNWISLKAEEFKTQGYTILENVLNAEQINYGRTSLDNIYQQQELKFGRENLTAINELDVARCPLVYDEFFLKAMVLNNPVTSFIRYHLGDYFVLHLQNGIINRPDVPHHQSSWHRDLPYQNYIISKPIAIAVLFCLDPFSAETGGTYVLPFSHQLEEIPSVDYLQKFQVQINANAGDAIIFNAMLFHRAGYNSSKFTRRGVNNVFTVPIIKQQIDLPRFLNGQYADDSALRRILGYENQSPTSVEEYRSNRLSRNKN
jgi:ectoine hydroxylase-related dioxygenase (phytanoyl-CoA dioxygenase family)